MIQTNVKSKKSVFIALIHPIQWTIANPVGVDWPAKRQTFLTSDYQIIMSSPSQKHGSCGHIMASFDSHSFCTHCREKGKGSDPCVTHNDCNSCNILTEDQHLQLSTPSYRLKKEKRDLKKATDTPKQHSSSSSLIDPSSVTVVGAVDDQEILQSPGSSSGKNKKAVSSEKTKVHSSKDLKPRIRFVGYRPYFSETGYRPITWTDHSSTDFRFAW